jgi:hypothetical protein
VKIFELFLRLWRSENSTEEITGALVDMVAPICYGVARRDRLASGTIRNMKRALEFLKMFPGSLLAFGNCPYIFSGAEKAEARLKYLMFPDLSTMDKIEVNLLNSVDEAENIRKAASERGIEPKCILLVTGELHSRSARFIWQKVFPSAKILVSCTDYRNEVDADHLVFAVRTPVIWTLANIARHTMLRLVGLRIRSLHHSVEK